MFHMPHAFVLVEEGLLGGKELALVKMMQYFLDFKIPPAAISVSHV
jgi:hypothetical protein